MMMTYISNQSKVIYCALVIKQQWLNRYISRMIRSEYDMKSLEKKSTKNL